MNTDKIGAYGVGLIIVGVLAIISRTIAIGILTAIEKNEILLGIGLVLVAGGLITAFIALVMEYRK